VIQYEDDIASVHLYDIGDDVLGPNAEHDTETMLAWLLFMARYDESVVRGEAGISIHEASEG